LTGLVFITKLLIMLLLVFEVDTGFKHELLIDAA
jgi:hypothetical protein